MRMVFVGGNGGAIVVVAFARTGEGQIVGCAPDSISGRQSGRHLRGIIHTQGEVHLGIGIGLVSSNGDYRGRIGVDRGIVDKDVVDQEVPAIAADGLEDDEAVTRRAVEGEGIFIPVVLVGHHRLQIGATMDGAQQLSAFRSRHRVVIHIDTVGAVDVGVAVTEDPETDKVVVCAQFQFG